MKRTNISFYLLILSALAVGGVITTLLFKVSPLLSAKTTFLCQKFISNMMIEVPRIFPQALIWAIGAVAGIGILSLLLQLVRTLFLLRNLLLKRVLLTRNLREIIKSLGLTNKVILVRSSSQFSFCSGFFSPFVVLSTGLVDSLTDQEIEAVLLHEESHLKGWDPIKVLLSKTFSSMFFFLPIFCELHKNTEAASELLADQWVISHQQTSTFLRSALKKILVAPKLNLSTVSNVSGPDYFEIRIHRLINPGIKYKFRLSPVSLITTLLFFIVSWFLLQAPVDAFHMDSQSKSSYLSCSKDQSCSRQCHHDTQQTNYIPIHLNLSEKKIECIDKSKSNLLH